MSHPEKFGELLEILCEVSDLRSAGALLGWDQATYLPVKGGAARGRQMATLSKIAHEKFVAPIVGNLLDSLGNFEKDLAPDSFEASLLRVTRRDYERATKVPVEFEARFSEHLAGAYETWTTARPENDFDKLRPILEKTLDFSREYAGFFDVTHPADALIEESDPGFTAPQISALFADLRRDLVPLLREVLDSRLQSNGRVLLGDFPLEAQRAMAREAVALFGYDFERGRMDDTHHPFMTKFSLDDVRITVRGQEGEAGELLFGALHEAGHALYEQGIAPQFEGTPLASGVSSGVHESQSRLWENLVGRSEAFWRFFWPRAISHLPALETVGPQEFLRAVNRVSPSLIRTEADELTYNLHVMIRFDLELEMLAGKLEIKDLPDAWNARYESDLGLVPPSNTDGCLQDVHWFGGPIGGAFQGYTLGNILSAQFFAAAKRAHPDLEAQFERGEFGALLTWLRENVHQFGRAKDASAVVQDATGDALNTSDYLDYLREKFLA